MRKNLKVFCDFDGTVTLDDVGDAFFTTFSGGKVLPEIARWEAGEINSRDLFLREIDMINVTQTAFDHFLNQQDIDTAFKPFVRFCDREQIPVTILSDGMDLYIEPILARNQLDHLSVYSNRLRWNGADKLEADFPYFENTCGHCANCKGAHLKKVRENSDYIVFIGDGFSDICAVPEADLIFAKNALAEYCKQNEIGFEPFTNFDEVLNWFEKNVSRFR